MAPNKNLLPDYASRNPPTFYITHPISGSALGLPPGYECRDAIGLEAQNQVDGSLRQEFQFTYDGRLINLACPQYALTAESNSGELKAMAPYSEESNPQRQQWTFDNGMIGNVQYPELKISAATGDSSFSSYYFAIVNPSTNLAIGVNGDCENGAELVLQAFVEGSPRQNFQALERPQGAEIVSIMCPNLAIGFTADDCAHGTQITLVNSPG